MFRFAKHLTESKDPYHASTRPSVASPGCSFFALPCRLLGAHPLSSGHQLAYRPSFSRFQIAFFSFFCAPGDSTPSARAAYFSSISASSAGFADRPWDNRVASRTFARPWSSVDDHPLQCRKTFSISGSATTSTFLSCARIVGSMIFSISNCAGVTCRSTRAAAIT